VRLSGSIAATLALIVPLWTPFASHDRLGHRELGVGALDHNRHHLAATQIRAYAGSSVHDLTDYLHSADLRQRDAADSCFLLVIDAQALADVRKIDSDSRRLDENLAGAW